MRYLFFTFTFALFVLLPTGCGQGTATAGANTGSNQSVTNTASEVPVEKAVVPEPATELSLATPTEAYRSAYTLRKNKDISGLKKIMSKDILEFMTMMGEADKRTLDDMLKEMCERPQADRAEVRNEKINGDRATVEYLNESGEWETMDFEKVDGKWLLSFPEIERQRPDDVQR